MIAPVSHGRRAMAYTFNTDLLLNERDREEARQEYPHIFFALDNPLLREAFSPYDERANVSKTRSRRWGVFAVFLATGALLLAGGEMLFQGLPKAQLRLVAGIGGVAGIVSVAIGMFGVMFRARKMRWLSDRLATERLRQFHFQQYVDAADEILKGAGAEEDADAYKTARIKNFERIQSDLLDRIEEELTHLVHSEDPGEGMLFDQRDHQIDPAAPHLQEYFDAYERLRFKRQIDYCDLVLREKKGFWKHAPVRQAQILGALALGCVLAILGLHAMVLFGALANIYWMKGPLVHVLAIWAAIIALTARTFEEGFQPEREIERMRHYRLSLKRLYERFKETDDPAEKITIMRELEKVTYQEMVLFLKGNYEAQFVM